MVDKVIYKKSEPDFMPFCVVNFRKDLTNYGVLHSRSTMVSASHDYKVSKNGVRLHNQLRCPPTLITLLTVLVLLNDLVWNFSKNLY